MSAIPFTLKWGSVYLGVGYNLVDHEVLSSMPDILLLLENIAFSVPDEQVEKPLTIDGHVCLGRTKKYLVSRCNQFLRNFPIIRSESTNTMSFVSKRQINQLIAFQENRKGQLSCHGFVILHMIFKILCETKCQGVHLQELIQLANCLNHISESLLESIEEGQSHVMAEYFHKSFLPVCDELQNGSASKTAQEFPGIPKYAVPNLLKALHIG